MNHLPMQADGRQVHHLQLNIPSLDRPEPKIDKRLPYYSCLFHQKHKKTILNELQANSRSGARMG